MSTISTHVLDTALGAPAGGVRVTLEDAAGATIGADATSADGRIADVACGRVLGQGTYRLRFAVDEYFSKTGREAFYPEVVVHFRVGKSGEHFHVPLLLSPYGYSTYRGS